MSTHPDQREWSGFEIAIIGMAGRFPGARDVETLWANLRAGVESISVLTDEELLAAGEDPARLADPAYVRSTSRLDDIDQFDAGFFGMTPREAELMDPQQRLFLEHAWVSLERAGYDPARCPGPVGVFGGVSQNGYFIRNLLTNAKVEAASLPVLFGNGNDFLATRVSYKLGLKGPALDVQTSCSSSLVAVHLACQSLLAGECDMALAGGVGIVIPQGRGYIHQEQGIYSPDGHCRAFSARAQGTVGGSGVAMVTLRRLDEAMAAGDNILAVIKGSAINNDGADKVGYAAPSVDGQAEVIRSALAMADVPADSIGYIESHGTGTSLGDPIEVAALTSAFRDQTQATDFCRIGSIKTNLGHLDSAAGVTGLIKAALAVNHAELPPSLHCENPDPKIDFPSTPFRVQTELEDWDCEGPRRAGVSSFGIGGTNAHIIVEEPPLAGGTLVEEDPCEGSSELFVLSARTSKALDAACIQLADAMAGQPGTCLKDAAWTLQVGRKDFPVRCSLVASDTEELAAKLRSAGDRPAFVEEASSRPAVFLFPGQGSQYVNMGRDLYNGGGVFKESVDRCCTLAEPHLGLDLRSLLYPPANGEAAATEQLMQTWLTQPALFVIEYALAQTWISWGVQPEAMIGHSIGEYVAAAIADVFSIEDAVALVAARGRLMKDLPAGDMLAVSLTEDELLPKLGPDISLAAVNEVTSCVVSGPTAAIETLAQTLNDEGVAARALHTSHAFHSAMMDPILDEFTERVRAANPQAPQRAFVSTMTGEWITPEEATDPSYWARHLRHAVRFAQGVRTLLAKPERVFLEMGPGTTLSTLATRVARGLESEASAPSQGVFQASMRHPRTSADDRQVLLTALGRAWAARVEVNWSAFHGEGQRRRLALPGYAFQRERYWIEPGEGGTAQGAAKKNSDVGEWFYEASWRRRTGALARPSVAAPTEVLILTDGTELAVKLAESLRSAGAGVSCVRMGEGFEVLGEDDYSVSPGARADYEALVGALMDRQRMPSSVYHLWSHSESECDSATALERGFLSVLSLVQVLGAERELDLRILTQGTADVLGDEDLRPEQATLVGLARAITQECPALTCQVLDWAQPDDAVSLMAELALPIHEGWVVCRGHHRWERWYEPVSVPAANTASLRDGAHTLIVGGLGSVGLEVARCIATGESARLTLVGRSEFPPKHAWDQWLEDHDPEDENAHCIVILRELEKAGSEVNVLRADVTDQLALAQAVVIAEAQFGPLTGAVHAAGAAKDMALLQETTRGDIEDQLRPKVEGLQVFEAVLGDRELDFCLIQSSLASCMGVYGMVGYVAAHDYVDAFVARHNREHSCLWMSVNWDHWLTWKEPEFLHDQGGQAYYMSRDEGFEAVRRVMALPGGTQLVVSTADLNARIHDALEGGAMRLEVDTEDLHARPDLASEYSAPSSEAEQVLVAAWGKVLGIAEIGVNDNFFELGGDSVIGLQVVSLVAQQGFKIVPAQIFEHPTIAGLAGVAQAVESKAVDQRAITGPIKLLPIQQWLFEQDIPTPNHFNLPMLFELPVGSSPAHVQDAMAAVVTHHDGLRVRYCTEGGSVTACHDDAPASCELEVVDLAALNSLDADKLVTSHAKGLHTSLDLERGPVMNAALFLLGPDRAPELLWVMHHLVVDVVSWRVLMEDFQTALAQLGRGEPIELPVKTASLQAWSNDLTEYANGQAQEQELAYWQSLGSSQTGVLGVDHDSGPNTMASSKTLKATLSKDLTRSLLKEVPGVYGTRIEEVLLAGLALGLNRSRGLEGWLVDLEGHGREDVVAGTDLSRTVGWLTTLYPALLCIQSDAELGETLKQVKEQVRTIPHHGIGFGALRYLSEDPDVRASLAALPEREMNFLYLGQFTAAASADDSTSMRILEERSGIPCNPQMLRAHPIETVSFVAEDQLQIELTYSENLHTAASAQGILDGFVAALDDLIEHCKDPTAGGHTPSDFPGARVSQASLDKLLSKIGQKKKGGQA